MEGEKGRRCVLGERADSQGFVVGVKEDVTMERSVVGSDGDDGEGK